MKISSFLKSYRNWITAIALAFPLILIGARVFADTSPAPNDVPLDQDDQNKILGVIQDIPDADDQTGIRRLIYSIAAVGQDRANDLSISSQQLRDTLSLFTNVDAYGADKTGGSESLDGLLKMISSIDIQQPRNGAIPVVFHTTSSGKISLFKDPIVPSVDAAKLAQKQTVVHFAVEIQDGTTLFLSTPTRAQVMQFVNEGPSITGMLVDMFGHVTNQDVDFIPPAFHAEVTKNYDSVYSGQTNQDMLPLLMTAQNMSVGVQIKSFDKNGKEKDSSQNFDFQNIVFLPHLAMTSTQTNLVNGQPVTQTITTENPMVGTLHLSVNLAFIHAGDIRAKFAY